LAGVQFDDGGTIQCVSVGPPDLSPNAQLTGTIIIVNEVELWDGGLTFHELALIVGGAFAIVAGIVSFYIIMGHATHYSKPLEQRQ